MWANHYTLTLRITSAEVLRRMQVGLEPGINRNYAAVDVGSVDSVRIKGIVNGNQFRMWVVNVEPPPVYAIYAKDKETESDVFVLMFGPFAIKVNAIRFGLQTTFQGKVISQESGSKLLGEFRPGLFVLLIPVLCAEIITVPTLLNLGWGLWPILAVAISLVAVIYWLSSIVLRWSAFGVDVTRFLYRVLGHAIVKQ